MKGSSNAPTPVRPAARSPLAIVNKAEAESVVSSFIAERRITLFCLLAATRIAALSTCFVLRIVALPTVPLSAMSILLPSL